MKPSKSEWASMLFWVLLGGAIVWGYGAANDKKAGKPAITDGKSNRRQQDVQAAVNAGPKVTAQQTAEGTVISLEIPKASAGGRFVEVKNCVVWRDAVTKTSSLHCDRDGLTDAGHYTIDTPDQSDFR